jgi:hypothetical protein
MHAPQHTRHAAEKTNAETLRNAKPMARIANLEEGRFSQLTR